LRAIFASDNLITHELILPLKRLISILKTSRRDL